MWEYILIASVIAACVFGCLSVCVVWAYSLYFLSSDLTYASLFGLGVLFLPNESEASAPKAADSRLANHRSQSGSGLITVSKHKKYLKKGTCDFMINFWKQVQ